MSFRSDQGAGLSRLACRTGVGMMLAMAIAVTQPWLRADERSAEIRALSIAASGLESIDASRRLVRDALDGGFNTLLLPIALEGDANPDRDAAIEAVIRDARERGLRVHASIRAIVASEPGDLPASRDHAIYRHPDWLMVPRELAIEMLDLDPRSPDYIGRLSRWTRAHANRADGLYVSPFQPEAVDYIARAVTELVARYPVDGVLLDGLRLPGLDFDYSRGTLDVFRATARRALDEAARARLDAIEAIDPFGYPEELAEEWRRFRIARLSGLVARLRTAVRSVRPEAIVSAGVEPGAERALDAYLQDWRTWLDNGLVDALSPGGGAGVTRLLFSYDTLLDAAPATASH